MVTLRRAAWVGALASLFVWQSGCGDDTICRGVVAIGAEVDRAALLKADGSLWTWDPGFANPVRGGLDASDAVGFVNAQLCLRLSTGGLRCDPTFLTSGGVSDLADPREVSSWWQDLPEEISSCAVLADGTLTCKLPGDSVFSPRAQGISNVAVGAGHFCALTTGGSVVCQPDFAGSASWSTVGAGLTGVVEVASLGDPRVSVVRFGTGEVLSINENAPGMSGSPPDDIAQIPITGIDGEIVQLVAGHDFACALRADGAVFCWADADTMRGEIIAGGTTLPPRWVPQRVALLPRPATALAAGDLFVCALLDDATVMCWGSVGADEKSGSPHGGFVESCG